MFNNYNSINNQYLASNNGSISGAIQYNLENGKSNEIVQENPLYDSTLLLQKSLKLSYENELIGEAIERDLEEQGLLLEETKSRVSISIILY